MSHRESTASSVPKAHFYMLREYLYSYGIRGSSFNINILPLQHPVNVV